MTITEATAFASVKERRKLKEAIMADGVSWSSAESYLFGRRRPMPLYQVQIQKHLRRIVGIDATVEELFPPKD